jgi:hypothetical protein
MWRKFFFPNLLFYTYLSHFKFNIKKLSNFDMLYLFKLLFLVQIMKSDENEIEHNKTREIIFSTYHIYLTYIPIM